LKEDMRISISKSVSLLLLATALLGFGKKEIKTIDRQFTQVQGKLYSSKYELSNEEYALFLKDIKPKDQELFEKCIYDSGKWTSFYPQAYTKPLQDKYHSHPSYGEYPIVNITYEAAVEYCNWLTERYNRSKKRRFKKVKFRLPTENEWILASRTMPDSILPWFGGKAYNQTNDYMANIKHIINGAEGKTTTYVDRNDRTIFMTSKCEFTENELGLFDMIGNVSEMVSEKGKAKGGNWNSFISECYIDQIQEYKDCNPEIGFRVFMELIEE